jgi:hypothetical protein
MLIVLKVELIKDILGLQVVVKEWLKQQNTHKSNTHLLKLITIYPKYNYKNYTTIKNYINTVNNVVKIELYTVKHCYSHFL